jgi:multisubunit Na+/H+ antiporter MnhB subunit
MRQFFAWLFLVVLMVFLVIGGFKMVHPFGEPPSAMDQYIIDNSQEQAGSNNVVAAVVFDYRGFDTLGEATVLFAAVTGVMFVLRAGGKKEET